ncbi:hypothetical protein [Sulfuricurvum sp.]|uniref:hypothetical protein n=1 Tax=Sulfuricurvum sp. TaxID=2025608 RepID=UPI00262DD74E|nr:hypothetical protein [Sulfuricurvum sp.]MDD3596766.1 hypothetical protein [Sulfuricurvum sp.]
MYVTKFLKIVFFSIFILVGITVYGLVANNKLNSYYSTNKMIKHETLNDSMIYTYNTSNVTVLFIEGNEKNGYEGFAKCLFKENGKLLGSYKIDNESASIENIYVFIDDAKKIKYYFLETSDSMGNVCFDILNITNNVNKIASKCFSLDDFNSPTMISKNKYLPITYTMFEKGGGLYLKVGSTYKSDIITLKKPSNVK